MKLVKKKDSKYGVLVGNQETQGEKIKDKKADTVIVKYYN